MQNHQFTNPADVMSFILAGNSRFTLVSDRTGSRYTYRLQQTDDNPNLFFLSLLTGQDNENDFTYIGIVRNNQYQWTRKVRLQPDSAPILAFTFAWRHVTNGILPTGCQIWHEGRCGRCHRALTVPASIALGIGPDCAQMMGIAA